MCLRLPPDWSAHAAGGPRRAPACSAGVRPIAPRTRPAAAGVCWAPPGAGPRAARNLPAEPCSAPPPPPPPTACASAELPEVIDLRTSSSMASSASGARCAWSAPRCACTRRCLQAVAARGGGAAPAASRPRASGEWLQYTGLASATSWLRLRFSLDASWRRARCLLTTGGGGAAAQAAPPTPTPTPGLGAGSPCEVLSGWEPRPPGGRASLCTACGRGGEGREAASSGVCR
jgi:hypothetical protein